VALSASFRDLDWSTSIISFIVFILVASWDKYSPASEYCVHCYSTFIALKGFKKNPLRSKNTGGLWVSQKLGVFFAIERFAKI